MTSPVFRAMLIVGAVVTLLIIFGRVRKSKIRMEDSSFWVALAVLLVIIAVFPQIAFFFSSLLGFESPSNFVFLVVCGVLLIKEFTLSSEVSRLKYKVDQLTQELALARRRRPPQKQ